MTVRKQIIGILLLTYSLSYSLAVLPVPLLVWSNDRSTSMKGSEVVLGTTLGEDVVESKLIGPILKEASHNVILFVFDKLSMDDFTRYSAVRFESKPSIFDHLKEDFTLNKGLLLSAVKLSRSGSMAKLMKGQHFDSVKELFSSDMDNWQSSLPEPNSEKASLLIMHLPPVGESNEEGKQKVLSLSDDIIGKVLKKYSTSQYTAFLTSEQPSEAPDAFLLQGTGTRHLLQVKGDNADKGIYNASGCVLMHAKGIFLNFKNISADFSNATAKVTGVCKTKNESSMEIQFVMNLPKKVSAFSLKMLFQLGDDKQWKCLNLTGEYTGTMNASKEDTLTLPFDCSDMQSPNLYSYSCGKSVFRDKASGMSLLFSHFQIQPFEIEDDKFEDAYDCVGFFTIPILMGLFVAFLLLIILLTAIMAVMSVQTMDRYDDPKEPTIHVAHE